MVKRNRRLLSLLTALVMLFSLMSGFTVFAADEPNEDMYFGLMIGSPRWDETEQKPVFDESLMGSEIFPEAGYHLDFTIGWKGADGVTPFTEEDMQNVTVKDGEGQPVDIGLTRAMYSYPDETTGRWEEAPAGDGIFRCRFMTPGEYTVTYEGEQQVDGVPAGATISYMVNVHANMPVVALYSDTEISADNLIGDEVTYMPGSSSYLLAIPEMGDDHFKTETEITDIELEDRLADYVTVEEVTKGEAYKVTVSESMDQPFSIQVTYQQADYEKQEDQEFHVIREVQNDFWFNFNAPLRLGFVADWTQWSDEDPDQPVVNVENMRGLLDRYEVGEWNTFTFAWKTSGEDVTLIPLSDMDKFTAYDENGDEVTEEWIRPARHWDEDAKQEVDRGDGFFDVRFPELGQYKIVYDAGDLGAHAVLGAYWGEAVYVNAIMPEVSLYSSETISIDTLIGSRAEYKDDERTFYVNIIDDIRSDWKNVITLTGFELEGPSDVAENVNVIAANGGGYKVVISDGYTEYFNLRVFIHNSQYRLEGEEWIEDGEWDRDYWFDFEYWEPEYYGLGVGWPRFEEESLPEFTDELFTAMGMEAKADRTLCFGWKSAEGEITPIPLADIDKFHLYDPDGNEVTGDWIRYPKRWNEGEEVELGIEGMFEVAFPGTGTYVIRYDKDISGEEAPEGMAVTDACKFHVEYPDVGIYSESTISDDALIGEHVIFDQDDRVFYVISADHKDSENIFIRTIKSYEVIMPYGFEDEAENTVTVEKVNDHTLKLTVAEDTELGFDLVTELFSTNKYYDHDEKQWVDGTDTWTDERMLNFWPKEILHYGLVAGFPKPKEEGGPMGNMQQYLDGFFELYGNALVFGWRDVEGNEVQIRKDDFISYFKVLDINGNEVPYEIEMQDNGDYIYEIRFLQQGIHYLYYDGDMAVDEEVEDTIAAICRRKQVMLYHADPSLLTERSSDLYGQSFVYQNREYRIPLTGKYQLFNASVVLKILEVLRLRGWTIPEESAAAGLAATNWPARMEMLWEEPLFFLDGGHNPQCIEALAGNLKELFPKKKITFLLGILGDKDYRQMLELLKDSAGSVICVTPNSSRALTGEELLQPVREIMGCPAEAADTIEEGIRKALETEKPPVVAVGSLYMAGELRSAFPKVLKQYLRRKAIRGREQLDPEKRKEYSDRIVDTILQTEEFACAKTILSYHAVRAEVSLERLHQIAESRGKTIAYPVCLDSETMEARSPDHPEAYRTGAFGIREPDPNCSSVIMPEEIDLIFCPCAGFDPHGGRIGMGAGYYDRYLKRCGNSRIFAVAFEAQKLKKAPMEDTDISMDAVITEENIYSD